MESPKKILLIYTGGTIGMQKSKAGEPYTPFNFELIQKQFPELLRFSCEIGVSSFHPPLDSSDVGPSVWVEIAKKIYENYNQFDGFVILHGTDTMAFTGSALSFMLEGLSKPVIMTGAQLPMGEIRTDARENLVTAIEIAAHPDTPVREVCIYFEYKLYRANRAKKIRTHSFSAFASPSFRPLAEAGVNIKFYRPTPEDAWVGIPLNLHTKLESKISLIKYFPGMSTAFVQSILTDPEIKGVIIESFGAGNLPTNHDLIDSFRESIEAGKVITNISQCSGGTVEMGLYATGKGLLEAGVISGRDLTSEAALTKMMYLMGKFSDPDDVKLFMARNIRGEMTAERAYATERSII